MKFLPAWYLLFTFLSLMGVLQDVHPREIDAIECLSTLSVAETVHNKNRIRMFILYNYRKLAGDILHGKGPYIDSLLYLFRQNCNTTTGLIERIKHILLSTRQIPLFAHKISNLSNRNVDSFEKKHFSDGSM